ncbi:MAG TPA: glycosyltransferase 87 family protein [Chloroflexota bacterium]|nr:glycosyltransferase 87 family protein [Chloroflexota bacterium]
MAPIFVREWPGWLRVTLLLCTAVALAVLAVRFAELRGTDTDLFPRWYGLRQLLLRDRNPYEEGVTREIAQQTAFLASHVEIAPAQVLPAYGFLYPLPGVLLLAPLALLPYWAGHALWLFLGAILLPTSGLLARSTFARRIPPETAVSTVSTAVVSLLFLPSLWNLALAQPGLAVVGLVAVALWLRQRRPAAAGAALMCAVLLKPQWVTPLAPFWLIFHIAHFRGAVSRRFLLGAGIAALLLCASATLLLPTWPAEFVRAASDYARVPQMAPTSPAVYVLAAALLPDAAARVLSAVAIAGIASWAIAGWFQPNHPERCGAWRSLVAGALVVPPAWETSAVMLLLPMAGTIGSLRGAQATCLAALVAIVSLATAPLAVFWPWRSGAVVIVAYVPLIAISEWWLSRPNRSSTSLDAAAPAVRRQPGCL